MPSPAQHAVSPWAPFVPKLPDGRHSSAVECRPRQSRVLAPYHRGMTLLEGVTRRVQYISQTASKLTIVVDREHTWV